jgi:TatA/E family protein of Tat protein translocase
VALWTPGVNALVAACPSVTHFERGVNMFGLGPTELIICGIVLILLFGNRLPSVMKSLGSSISEFKKGIGE